MFLGCVKKVFFMSKISIFFPEKQEHLKIEKKKILPENQKFSI